MNNAQKYMGSKFYPYNAKSNNCQDYLLAILKESNIGDESDYSFIKQDTKKLFEKTGYLGKISKGLTDLGAKAAITMQGGNLKDIIHRQQRMKKITPSDKFIIDKKKNNNTIVFN